MGKSFSKLCANSSSSSADQWPTDFTPTERSFNKCDALWENVKGKHACFVTGCYWGPSAQFGAVPGVIRIQTGFTGGVEPGPSSSDPKGHYEAVEMEYDEEKVSYEDLLELFWDNHKWWNDNKPPYGSMIVYYDESQEAAAKASIEKMKLSRDDVKVSTQLVDIKDTIFCPETPRNQHYFLQQNKDVCRRIRIPPEHLAYSHLACKVEGYMKGYVSPEKFDERVAELYLPPELVKTIRALCVKNQLHLSCAV